MHLARGSREVHAIISVEGRVPATRGAPETATVFLLDCSGSMGRPWSKLREACRATANAVDAMPDGSWFAIVRGNHRAEPVYPAAGGLACASAATRQAAALALRLVVPDGGTAMGRWLLTARDVIATRPDAIGHAILLTDGRNESESAAALEATLAACRTSFRCDCRGIGADWEVAELRRIASAMHGTVDLVADPIDLADESPVDGRRFALDERTGSYLTGPWAAESREYHLCIDVPEQAVGSELLASRVEVMVGGDVVSKSLVPVLWSEDQVLTAQVDPNVAHYTGQTDLAGAIQRGLQARPRRRSPTGHDNPGSGGAAGDGRRQH